MRRDSEKVNAERAWKPPSEAYYCTAAAMQPLVLLLRPREPLRLAG